MAFSHRSFINSVALAKSVAGLVVPMVLLFSIGACKTEGDCRPGTVLLKLACAPEAVKYEVRVVVGTQPGKSLNALEQTCTGTTSLEVDLKDSYVEGEAIQVFVTPIDANGKALPEQVLAASLLRGCTGVAAFAGGDGTIPKNLDGGIDSEQAGPCVEGAVCDPDPSLCRSSGKLECEGGRRVCKPAEVPQVDGVVCGTDKVCLGGQCQACVTDASCELDNKCKLGKTSCTTGLPICMDTGSVAEGTACGTSGSVCLAGTCVACQEGAACVPPENVCSEGKLACAGVPKCVATTTSAKNGTSCGTGKVCGDGACVACVAGDICEIAGKPCRTGVVTCNTGKVECLESSNAPNGRTCGDAAAKTVCSNGACKECVVDKACTPANPCHQGAQTCTGDLTCTDTGKPVADGLEVCGAGKVCKAGACSDCVAGGDCTPPGTVCKAGKFSCASGSQLCEPTGNASNGTKCENNDAKACANGLCTDCMAGSACDSGCKTGTLSCTGATKACNLTQNRPDGTACGTDLVCKSGSCAPCKPNELCFPFDNRCKTGVTECSSGASLCKETGNVMDGSTLGECAAGQACKNGACAACPNVAPVCSAGAGTFCSDNSLITCTKPGAGCMTSAAQSCAGGCKPNGANSSCCPAAPAACGGLEGTVCVAGMASTITCTKVDMCLKETATTACPIPANSTAFCRGTKCGRTCNDGFADCADGTCRKECPNFITFGGERANATATGVNRDGTVVIGTAIGKPFAWRKASGTMDFLPLPEGTSFADAREVSGDGTVVVGKGSGGLIWTPFGVSTLELDVATGISDDGSVVVGNRGPSAMRWVGGNYETAASGSAEGVSLDGKVLVGAVPAPLSHGYYIKAGGTSNAILGTVVAKAANIDGTVIVGGKPAFRWTAATGPQTLPNPAGVEWVAEDVSGDGTVVVGSPDGFTITDTAVIWRVGIGSKLLSTLLRDAGVDVTGWSFSKANGISADGKVVVGYAFHPNGNSFAFRAVLP